MIYPPHSPPLPQHPPLPPPLFPLEQSASSSSTAGDEHYSYNPSILIIAAIIAAAIVAVASIHILLRVLSRSRTPPFVHRLASSSSSSSSSASSSSASAPSSPPTEQDPKAVIDTLPLFSLSSSTAKPSSSLDCAVCLSPFQLADELRLLPSCRHAFHSQCIDTWLKSNLSCPLCRSPIAPVPSPPPPPVPLAAEPARSDSFRVEIGSVSRRTDDSSAAAPPHAMSYSLGSSFEYVVDEEIEAVLARVRRRPVIEKSDLEQAPRPPGADVAEIAGTSHRSWLKDYVDRLTSSASSSFSSLRFSQRGSHRLDSASTGGGVVAGGDGWDLERNLHLHLEEEDGGFSAFYRWLLGA